MGDWMTEAQRNDYNTVCILIDGVTTEREFYTVCDKINSGKYDFDAVAKARENKHFYNSAQFAGKEH